jgi:hypothetical protein
MQRQGLDFNDYSMNRQTPTTTDCCGNVQIQRGLPGIEEWQGSGQNGGGLQQGIKIAYKEHYIEPLGSIKILHGVNVYVAEVMRARVRNGILDTGR